MKTIIFKALAAIFSILLLLSTQLLPTQNRLGDTNKDGLVNLLDLLSIGLFYGATENPTWPQIGNLNAQHADCNQDGVVNETDMTVIEENYGMRTRGQIIIVNNNSTKLTPLVQYPTNANYFTVKSPGEIANIPLLFQLTSNQALDNIAGIAFKVAVNNKKYCLMPLKDDSYLLHENDSSMLVMDRGLTKEWNYAMTKKSIEGTPENLPINTDGMLFRASCIVTIDLNRMATPPSVDGGIRETTIDIKVKDAFLLRTNGVFEKIATEQASVLVRAR